MEIGGVESFGGDRRGGEFGWRVWVEIGGVESFGGDRRGGEIERR